MSSLCSLYHCCVLSLPIQHGAVFPIMLCVERCGAVRLDMKVGCMNNMHCLMNGISKCQTVYDAIKSLYAEENKLVLSAFCNSLFFSKEKAQRNKGIIVKTYHIKTFQLHNGFFTITDIPPFT